MRQIPSFRRRLLAARILAGHDSAEALADAIGERGLSAKVIYSYERGTKAPELRDLEAIARACGLPVEWFVADFSRLRELAPLNPEDQIRRLLEEAREQSQQRAGSRHADSRR